MTGRPTDGYVKSSYSDSGGNCVLVRRIEGDPNVFIRDSKFGRGLGNQPEDEPIIEMPAAAWATFEALVLGRTITEAAVGCPEIQHAADNGTVLRGTDHTTLAFTGDEWSAFRAGLVGREFEPRKAAA
ncbi:DUF397 domain-containing protein [Nocardia sp. R16R-3T]